MWPQKKKKRGSNVAGLKGNKMCVSLGTVAYNEWSPSSITSMVIRPWLTSLLGVMEKAPNCLQTEILFYHGERANLHHTMWTDKSASASQDSRHHGTTGHMGQKHYSTDEGFGWRPISTSIRVLPFCWLSRRSVRGSSVVKTVAY